VPDSETRNAGVSREKRGANAEWLPRPTFSLRVGNGAAVSHATAARVSFDSMREGEVTAVTYPRVYADFNGLVSSARTPARHAVALDTFGTLRELSNAGVRLREGDRIIVYDWSDDTEDLEGHGTVYFDADMHLWFVELDERGVMYVAAYDRTSDRRFLCLGCRTDLAADMPDSARPVPGLTACDHCGRSIGAALAPPPRRTDNPE
jgi:hypothetical protein